jgi:hypothetical protein
VEEKRKYQEDEKRKRKEEKKSWEKGRRHRWLFVISWMRDRKGRTELKRRRKKREMKKKEKLSNFNWEVRVYTKGDACYIDRGEEQYLLNLHAKFRQIFPTTRWVYVLSYRFS